MCRVRDGFELNQRFPSREIIALIRPVLEALQTLSDAGLVHRDVKPENILFFNGQPCLGDISLLGADASLITRRGTPGYGTPSWYVGGLPDMYGVAATLFTMLTGNLPDRMGRATFLWPPQGEASLSIEERAEWKRLHGVIRRATEEKVAERFVDFRTMADALRLEPSSGEAARSSTQTSRAPALKKPKLADLVLSLVLVGCVGGCWLIVRSVQDVRLEPLVSSAATPPSVSTPINAPKPTEPPSPSAATLKQHDDAKLAHGALSASQGEIYDPNNTEDPVYMTTDENNLYQDTLVKVWNCIEDANHLDFSTAIQVLDQCTDTLPGVRSRPNARLARLLLQQCADGSTTNPVAVEDPSFLVLGNDDLGYRVALLCGLGANVKAEEFLGNFVAKESRSIHQSILCPKYSFASLTVANTLRVS